MPGRSVPRKDGDYHRYGQASRSQASTLPFPNGATR